MSEYNAKLYLLSMLAKKCIVCGKSTFLKRVIELGFHPPADTFVKKDQLLNAQNFYPLNCLLCTYCGHFQNEYFVSGEERYIESNYSYTSSNSPSAMSHWDEFADTVSKHINLEKGDHVIEFGSNDGYLTLQFQKKGAKGTGIDPSPIMSEVARKSGVNAIAGFLGKGTVVKAVKKYGKAKLICGNNVLNHIENLNDAMKAIKSGLKDEGFLVVEVPSLKDTVGKYLFDMIFHEHISTFSVKSIDYLLKKNGLYIAKVKNIPYHGGSLRVYASADKSKYNNAEVKKQIADEERIELFSPQTYKKFMAKITKDKNDLLATLYSLKKQGKRIAAVGGGARSNTLLNFYRLDSTVLEFLTDASKHKIGKFTPGSNIEIKDDNALLTENIDVALITAWNIGRFLTNKIRKVNPKIQFIVPGEKELM